MGYLLSESDVLHKLGIQDFNQLTKSEIIQLTPMLDKMEPEVAQKALEQCPEFTKTSKEILSYYKDILEKGLSSNDKSLQSVYESYYAIINSLQKLLENDNLSFEEKIFCLEKMKEIADRIDKKDSENKKWIIGMAILAGIFLVGGVAVGVGIAVSQHNKKDDDEIGCIDDDDPMAIGSDDVVDMPQVDM